MTNQILKKNVKEPLKTIFYLPHYASLLKQANAKIDHAHCLKLCPLKCIIFLENQHFRIFQRSNIRKESRWLNKNHFLSDTIPISVTIFYNLLQSFSIFDWSKFPKWCFLTKIITLGRHSFEQWAWQVLDFT